MKIAYAVPHQVTGAVGQRVQGVARALLSTGHVDEVTVLGPAHDINENELPGLSLRVVEQLNPGPRTATDKLLRRARLGNATRALLDSMAVLPDLVIGYGGGALYMNRLQEWARNRKVKIAADIVEWYDSGHLPMGKLGPFALDNHLMMTRVAPRCDGVLTVSTFLAHHFHQRGNQQVLIVPPVLDALALKNRSEPHPPGRTELVYCGDPGKKDRLDLVLRAAIQIDPYGHRLRVTVAGPNPQQVAKLAGVDTLPPVVNAVGRLSRPESMDLVGNADWMPLIRDDLRFARAGFPTKVAEAMSFGTPIMANLTSDLGQLLEHDANGIVIRGADLAAIQEALMHALEIRPVEYEHIRKAARSTALSFFDYREYVVPLTEWLDRVMNKES